MRRSRTLEADIQRAVFTHLRTRPAAGVVAFHVPNGGYRRPAEASILQGLGVVSGVPDVIVIKGGHAYGLELKTEDGRLSPAQHDTMAAMMAAGATCAVAYGIDQALHQLECWGLLRGRAAVPKLSVVA